MPALYLVDDSATVRSALTEMLTAEGWTVEAFADAESAGCRAAAAQPDVVVADLRLPGMSGLQLCRLLRSMAPTSEIPIVLLTAAGDRRSRFWAEESGASAFLEKRSVQDLPRVLARLVAGRPKAQASAAVPLDRKALAGRMSNLLDEALFESILSNKLRSLALEATSVRGLFGGLARLMSAVSMYRWMALGVRSVDGGALLVQANPRDARAGEEAQRALHLGGRPNVWLMGDERCEAPAGGRHGAPLSWPLQYGDTALGGLAADLGEGRNRDGIDAFELAARELALPLHLVELLESAKHLALTDQLTGLPNRRAGGESLDRALREAGSKGAPLAVAMIDIDHFKRVNDEHGHAVGDATLRHVAALLRRCCRRSDVVARWGGEEFLVILPQTTEEQARVACERLRAAVAVSPLSLNNGSKLGVTVSLGVSEWRREGAAALLERADKALYAAKQAGRNRVQLAA